ncbi:hypothetical protein V6N13_121593 [Hibiscus sabdariffa]
MVVIDTDDVDDGFNHLYPFRSNVQYKALCFALHQLGERPVLKPQSAETVAEDEILDTSELQSTTKAVVVDEILDTSELQSSIDSMLEMESPNQTYYIRSSDAS